MRTINSLGCGTQRLNIRKGEDVTEVEKGNWKEEEGSQRHAQVRSQFSKFQILVCVGLEVSGT